MTSRFCTLTSIFLAWKSRRPENSGSLKTLTGRYRYSITYSRWQTGSALLIAAEVLATNCAIGLGYNEIHCRMIESICFSGSQVPPPYSKLLDPPVNRLHPLQTTTDGRQSTYRQQPYHKLDRYLSSLRSATDQG